MNSSKFFIAIILIVAVFAALSDILFSFLGLYKKATDVDAPTNLLPATIDEDTVNSIIDRSNKYLVLQPQQFEEGKETK